MKLSAPTNIVFLIAVILFVLALLAQFGVVSALAAAMPWLWIAAFVLLALGVLLNEF
jgi:hypothetical protein